MNAVVDADLIEALFCPSAPMHDGAIVVRLDAEGGRVVAARALLPLAQARAIAGDFGTRHRAAVGLTEESDALVMVISEERRDVHLAEDGKLGSAVAPERLRQRLSDRLLMDKDELSGWNGRIRRFLIGNA